MWPQAGLGAAGARVLPITCPELPGQVLPGDTLYVGRYLAAGAPEQGSLFLEVHQVRAWGVSEDGAGLHHRLRAAPKPPAAQRGSAALTKWLAAALAQVTPALISCVALNRAELEGLLTLFHLERSEHGLHNAQSRLPPLHQFDKDCLRALAEQFEVDFVGLSFTNRCAD